MQILSANSKFHILPFIHLPYLSLYVCRVQTKLGMLTKSESEHQALQVGQKCARTLLQWIPFMNVGKLFYYIEQICIDLYVC